MRRVLSFVVLLLLAAAVYAQETPAAEPRYIVRYAIDTFVQPAPEQAFAHPAIEALARQAPLGSLEVSMQGAERLYVKATFEFSDLSDFQRWYAAEATRALLRMLGEDAEHRAHLAVQRIR